jgi:peptide/nickel transport system substrate-binding protein
MVGDLAEKWEISPDAKVFTFSLRKGVTWHDGQPFTAKDVEFTFRRHIDNRTNSVWAPPLLAIVGAKALNAGDAQAQADDKLAGIEVVDDATVRFTLETPSAAFLAGAVEIPILPEHILGPIAPAEIEKSAFATGAPIGTGPFKFNSWKSDEFIELTRNDDYFKGAPKIDKIFVVKVDPEPAKVMLQRGELDFTIVSGPDVAELQSLPDIQIQQIEASDFFGIGYCADASCKPALQPKELRQAMLYAIDRQAINQVAQAGLGKVINTMPMPPWVMDGCALPVEYSYNPDKAKELLKQINWDPTTELAITNWGGWRGQAATAIQQMWAAVGIKARVDQFEFTEAWKRVQDGTYATAIQWPEQGLDPDSESIYFGEFPTQGNNTFRYRNPELDKLWADGRQTVDKAARQKIYCQIAQTINAEVPFGPLFTNVEILATNKRLQHVSVGFNRDFGWHWWRSVEQWDVSS